MTRAARKPLAPYQSMTNATLPGSTDAASRIVVVYERVSTDKQDIARQAIQRERASQAHPELEVVVLQDDGVSAFKVSIFDRPDGRRLCDLVEAGRVEAIFTDAQDRLSRGEDVEWVTFRTLCDTAGTRIVIDGQELRTDIGGKLQGYLKALVAHDESEEKSHRIKSAKATRAQAGKPYHGSYPPGYRQNPDKPDELIRDDDFLVIAAAFDRYLEGQTYSRICKFLEENLSNEYFQRSRSKKRVVRPDHLRRWLSNPIYVGMIRHKGELTPGQHRAAVSQDTFDRAQRRLARLAAEFVKPARRWPFSGIAKCARCGHGMRLHPVKNRHGQHFFYVRCNAPSSGTCGGRGKSIIAAAFEVNLVLTLASVACTTTDLLAHLPQWGISEQDGQQTMVEARAALRDAEEHLADMAEMVKDRAFKRTGPEYREAVEARDAAELDLERVARRRSSYREELAQMAAPIEALAIYRPHHPVFEQIRKDARIRTRIQTGRDLHDPPVDDILEGWLAAPFEARRDVVVATLEKALVSSEGTELHFTRGFPGPVALRLAVEPRRGPTLHALEAVGWGVVEAGVGMVRPPLLRRFDSANLASETISEAIATTVHEINAALRDMDFAKAA